MPVCGARWGHPWDVCALATIAKRLCRGPAPSGDARLAKRRDVYPSGMGKSCKASPSTCSFTCGDGEGLEEVTVDGHSKAALKGTAGPVLGFTVLVRNIQSRCHLQPRPKQKVTYFLGYFWEQRSRSWTYLATDCRRLPLGCGCCIGGGTHGLWVLLLGGGVCCSQCCKKATHLKLPVTANPEASSFHAWLHMFLQRLPELFSNSRRRNADVWSEPPRYYEAHLIHSQLLASQKETRNHKSNKSSHPTGVG